MIVAFMTSTIFTLPNLISFIRILLAPVLLTAGLMQLPGLFLWAFAFSLLTDFLDGFLARLLNQMSKLGSQLDTVGDVLTGVMVIVSGTLLWPEEVKNQAPWFLQIILILTLSGIVTLVKYHHLPSYHTWSAKLSTATTGIGVWILFAGYSPLGFHIGVVILSISALEEIAITLSLPAWQPNVPHIFHALKLRRQASAGQKIA
jgi:phosphatidylglycerophosphate synthase